MSPRDRSGERTPCPGHRAMKPSGRGPARTDPGRRGSVYVPVRGSAAPPRPDPGKPPAACLWCSPLWLRQLPTPISYDIEPVRLFNCLHLGSGGVSLASVIQQPGRGARSQHDTGVEPLVRGQGRDGDYGHLLARDEKPLRRSFDVADHADMQGLDAKTTVFRVP